MKKMLGFFAAGAVSLYIPLAQAAHPLVTEDTGTQGQGHYQFEFSVDQTRTADAGAVVHNRVFSTTLTYGLTDTLDVAISLPHLLSKTDPSPPKQCTAWAILH